MPVDDARSGLRPWTWAISEAGAGPDHAAWLSFEESVPDALDEAVRSSDLRGFVAHRHTAPDGRPTLTCIDRFHSAAFRRNLRGRGVTNIWTYRSVQVTGGELLIENGYGGGSGEDVVVQTELIVRLVTEDLPLRLVRWVIGASDTGIRTKSLREGETPDSLLAYLRH